MKIHRWFRCPLPGARDVPLRGDVRDPDMLEIESNGLWEVIVSRLAAHLRDAIERLARRRRRLLASGRTRETSHWTPKKLRVRGSRCSTAACVRIYRLNLVKERSKLNVLRRSQGLSRTPSRARESAEQDGGGNS